MEGTIFKLGYRNIDNRLYVHALGRATDGSKIDKQISGTRPYFYIDQSQADVIPRVTQIVASEPGPVSMLGNKTIRVYTRFPYEVPIARKEFRWTAEADIVYTTRERVDHGLIHVGFPDGAAVVPIGQVRRLPTPPLVKPRVLTIDIEVDDSKGFPRATDPDHPITAISFHDNYQNQYGLLHSNDVDIKPLAFHQHFPRPITDEIRVFQRLVERDLLAAFGSVLQRVQPDVITAWNGYKFDYPYLGERTARVMSRDPNNPDLQRVIDTVGRLGQHDRKWRSGNLTATVDSMVVFQKREMKQRSWGLQNVAMDLLGYGKVERPLTVSQLQKTDPEKWGAYGVWDTSLVVRIDAKQRLVNYIHKVAWLAGVDPEDCLYEGRIVDGRALMTARKHGTPRICLPTKLKDAEEEDARGALTLPPVVGMHIGVVGFDFKQEYPNLQMTFNISTETRVEPSDMGKPTTPPTRSIVWGSNSPSCRHEWANDHCDGCTATRSHYRTDVVGILPETLVDMVAFRNVAKGAMASQTPGTEEYAEAETEARAIKFFVNAVAGVIKSKFSRYYSPDVFGDITGMAREQLTVKKRLLEAVDWVTEVLRGFIERVKGTKRGSRIVGQVLYGDTDSTFAKFFFLQDVTNDWTQITDTDELNEIAKLIQPALNKEYDAWAKANGAEKNYTEDGIEGVFSRMRLLPLAGNSGAGAKKRYFACYDIKDGKDVRRLPIDEKVRLKIAGVEFKRFNNATVTSTVTLAVMKGLMEGATVEQIVGGVEAVERAALKGEIDDELLVRCKMGKPNFDAYASKQPFVRAMMAWNQITGREVNDGDEFHWAYLSERFRGHNVVAIPLSMTLDEARRQGFDLKLDRPRMIEQTITQQVRKVFPEIDAGPDTASEDDF